MTYAAKIKLLREKLVITQHELATLLEVSFVTVNRWENDKFQPTTKTKRKLNELLSENKIETKEIKGNNNDDQ
jgi:DNA-binding XRE family transcriptional regulator